MRHDICHSRNYLSSLLSQEDEQARKDYLSGLTVRITRRDTLAAVSGLLQYYMGLADKEIRCETQSGLYLPVG